MTQVSQLAITTLLQLNTHLNRFDLELKLICSTSEFFLLSVSHLLLFALGEFLSDHILLLEIILSPSFSRHASDVIN